jgi:hypothetical protein
MSNVKHQPVLFIFFLLSSLYIQPLLAIEQLNNDNTALHEARTQLSLAFDKYNDGDITAAKQNLKLASEWLNRAEANIKADKVKIEARKLASELDNFRSTLMQSTEHDGMARFWHRATSLIKRESEHLIHSYTESANNNRILKHLLDAKMHFYTAEHDLFVSHDSKDAQQELNNSLNYLTEANAIARPDLKPRIQNLTSDIKVVNLVHSLNKATTHLTNAEKNATPATKLRLKSIKQNIHQLKLDVQKTSIKTRYESIMANFTRTINNI